MVNTCASNADKHPGRVDLPDSDESSDSSKQGKGKNAKARKQNKGQSKAEEEASKAEKKKKEEGKLALARLDIQVEDEAEKDNAELPRSRKRSDTDKGLQQPPKKKQKEMEGSDMEVDVCLQKDGGESYSDNMDIEDTVQTSALGSATIDKGRFESEELSSLMSSDEENGQKTPTKAPSKHRQVNQKGIVKPRLEQREERGPGNQIDKIVSSEDVGEGGTPKATSKAHRTTALGDPTALFNSDEEEGSKTPVQTNRSCAAKAKDVPIEDEAEQTKSSNATKNTRRRLKREGAFILDIVENIPKPQAGNFLDKIKSKHVKPGSGQKDHDRKKHDQGSPNTDAVTSSKATGQVPKAKKRNKKCSHSFTESEKSQSELPESPVKVHHHKEKAVVDKGQKEIDELKEMLREKKRAQKADKAHQHAADKAKANGSHSSLPAFEEDQEVERQVMLSSPLKKGKHVTSDSLVKVEKKGVPKLPREKRSAKVKKEVNSANKIRPRPVHRVPSSRQPKPVDKSEEVLDQDDLENRPEKARGKRSAKTTQKADSNFSDVVELDDTSDEPDTKSKARCKRPTNDANLLIAVRNDLVTWRVTILGAYRAHMACTEEVWTINNGTTLRHLQIIWDFYMEGKQPHSFVANDPVLSLLKQKASDWHHKIGDAGLQALRKYFDQNNLDSDTMRNTAVGILLDDRNFVYKHLETNDNNKVVDRHGPFCSQPILHTFAAHLSMLNGKSHEFPGLPPLERPIAAMALATTAVERALMLWRDGILQDAVPTTRSKSVPSFDIQVDSRSQYWKFSADNWSHSTSYFVGQLRKIDQPRWNKIVEAAKIYLDRHVQELRKNGSNSAQNVKLEDGVDVKNLELKWDSD